MCHGVLLLLDLITNHHHPSIDIKPIHYHYHFSLSHSLSSVSFLYLLYIYRIFECVSFGQIYFVARNTRPICFCSVFIFMIGNEQSRNSHEQRTRFAAIHAVYKRITCRACLLACGWRMSVYAYDIQF